jgi:hypothetical protein
MATLTPDTVNEIIRRERPGAADAIIAQFTDALYRACRIPQDLEFTLDYWDREQALPTSRPELYRATVAAVLRDWDRAGQSDYLRVLHQRALDMLRTRSPAFDPKGVPDMLCRRLLEAKLLVRRGDLYHFRHDLIRAYLASVAFTPDWRNLLGEGTIVDSNWLPMLQFVLLQIDQPDEAKALMMAVLRRNRAVAGDLFRWLQESRPELCAGWEDDFRFEFGKDALVSVSTGA